MTMRDTVAAPAEHEHEQLVIETPTPASGLTDARAAELRAAGHGNDVRPASGRTTGEIIRANVFTRINAMLGVLAVLVLSTGSWINAAFGLLIIANSGVGIIQELRAKRTLDRLAIVGEARPRVRRDGNTAELHQGDVVRDDIIELGAGDQIVVDGVLTEARVLEVDESMLTGEADPVHKSAGDPVLSGSFVVAGSGAFQAVRVGGEAYAAKLTEAASRFTLVNSELRSGIDKILKVITLLLVPTGLLTIYNQLAGDNSVRDAILGMAGALVPMVPEGLVLMTSIAFAVGVVRLGQRQCLVQELPAIEGLARVSVVCADKTGTLTENGMRMSALESPTGGTDGGWGGPADPGGSVAAAPAGAAPVEPAGPDGADPQLVTALRSMVACDPRPNASVEAISEWLAGGAAAPAPAAPAASTTGETWTPTAVAAFTSAKKWSGASFGEHGNWLMGAPDVLCEPGSAAANRAEELGRRGLRVLLVATGTESVDADAAPGVVTPRALVVLEQRVRPDARDTLDYFGLQNVEVKVISGDNAVSVGAVTSGLGVPGGERALDARELPADDEGFAEALATHTVFGRVTPDQKQRMVGALQSRGHNVAMTGDGVNDVLALKDADIGVAMGSGSPAARGVAQIVLLDNRFATLPHVVGEGRRVIGNIERVANLFLTKTVYSALFALFIGLSALAGLLDDRYPFMPIHVTITGWFTIGIPAFLLALAPNHERARPGFVPRVMRLALPSGVIVAVATYATYMLTYPGAGGTDVAKTQASTAALVALLLSATWVLSVVSRPYRWWKLALVGMSLAGYGLIFATAGLRRLFFLDIGDASTLFTGVAIGLAGALLVEAAWWITGTMSGERRPVWAHD